MQPKSVPAIVDAAELQILAKNYPSVTSRKSTNNNTELTKLVCWTEIAGSRSLTHSDSRPPLLPHPHDPTIPLPGRTEITWTHPLTHGDHPTPPPHPTPLPRRIETTGASTQPPQPPNYPLTPNCFGDPGPILCVTVTTVPLPPTPRPPGQK